MRNKKILIAIIFAIGFFICIYFLFFYSPYKFRGAGAAKILHVDSYSMGYGWSKGQIDGFLYSLEKEGVVVELRSVNLDSEIYSDSDYFLNKSYEADKIVESWEPDLIYITDDYAQEYFGQKYINSNIPIVYSGIDNPDRYGYDNAKNIGGVLEVYPFSSGIDFLLDIFPNVRDVVLVTSNTSTGVGLFDVAKKYVDEFPNINFEFRFADTFNDYQKLIIESQGADALIEIPLLNLVDDNGSLVSIEEIQKWTVENSFIPDLTYWDILGFDGVLLNYAYRPEWDGELAGKIAYEILFEGESPNRFANELVNRGQKEINIARARTLGIEIKDIPSTVLINSEVFENFAWEKE